MSEESNIGEPQYDLRFTDTLRPPSLTKSAADTRTES